MARALSFASVALALAGCVSAPQTSAPPPPPLPKAAPPPPEVIELDVDDSYTLASGLGPLGRVYDQDTSNMKAQTRGFRSSRKRGQTLGNYQEVRARHLQQRVRDHLRAGGFTADPT